jgi:uncharacterized cupin superfamily protein
MKRINLATVPEEEQRSPTGKFHSFHRNVSIALGGMRNTGTWGGGHPFDFQVRRLPPGAAVCPFHSHLAQWEFFLVRRGTGTVRAGAESHPIQPGEVFVHPPGEPHQLLNSGPGDLDVFIFADNPAMDGCYYPDSDKWAVHPPGRIFRMAPVDYFDGEETPITAAPPRKPAATPPPAEISPFATRHLHPDNLPWDSWSSPKGKYRADSKELSLALGAKRNAPTGLGGHPFDLELGRLAPRATGCVFHWHAAQWEMYIFLEGAATVRTAEGTVTAGPGDVVLHPPFEAHQFANAGDTDLVYLLVADNPQVDYWHYPDSGKWGHREPRKIFRATDADYHDGEE